MLGRGIGDDPSAYGNSYRVAAKDHGADRDAELHVRIAVEVADGAAVGSARRRLELMDDLSGADLGRAGDAAAGKCGLKNIEEADVLGAGYRRQ